MTMNNSYDPLNSGGGEPHKTDPEFSAAEPALTPAQEEYLDSLLEAGAAEAVDRGAGRHCPADADGRDTLAQALAVLSRMNLEEVPADIAARTMARIHQRRVALPAAGGGGTFRTAGHRKSRWRIGWNERKMELAAMLVAASLVMAVLIAGIGRARQHAARTLCAANLTNIAAGVREYAAANSGFLPSVTPVVAADWLPGPGGRSGVPSLTRDGNAANIAPLLEGGARYVSWGELICPITEHAADIRGHFRKISYSYIDELGKWHHRFGWGGHVVIFADANPLFARRAAVDPEENSFNHNEAGENILCDDGSVRWVASPLVGPAHDNIYTLQTVVGTHYTGYEEPASAQDIFLAP